MTDYYLTPKTETQSGAKDGDVKLSVTSDVITISIYGSGKWTTQTWSTDSQTPYFSQHATTAAFPVTGSVSRLYLALNTEILYYWDAAASEGAGAYAQCVGGT